MTIGELTARSAANMPETIGYTTAACEVRIDQEGRNRAAKIHALCPRQSFLCI
ncbi:Unknown protein sequence [Pseudomonas amygdali pv. lachrymans]|nr:Unknown protein sequence [Pseudomonas amygdali pv. lachrymans]